mmetsp:Transcript_81121/g.161316  ORF Transcript_81121/g.161316 Transcript_81121/m.161316 type:complete len:266 (-) Transcript_81121:422-1219(-)
MAVASDKMALDFSITWKPFFLDPRLPGGEGKDKHAHYISKFGAERVNQMVPHMVQTFEAEGIPGYNINGRVGNTMDSHRLLEYALKHGGPQKQDQLMETLFTQYFLRGQPLSSRAVLLKAAGEVQLDGAEVLLSTDGLLEQVWSEVEHAYSAGVSGVPYFRIDGGGQGKEVSGGQPPEAFLKIFASLAAPTASPSSALGFTVGSTVRVSGLKAKPEHNGHLGEVLGRQGVERVQVRLLGGVELALKPANLEPYQAGNSEATIDLM